MVKLKNVAHTRVRIEKAGEDALPWGLVKKNLQLLVWFPRTNIRFSPPFDELNHVMNKIPFLRNRIDISVH